MVLKLTSGNELELGSNFKLIEYSKLDNFPIYKYNGIEYHLDSDEFKELYRKYKIDFKVIHSIDNKLNN